MTNPDNTPPSPLPKTLPKGTRYSLGRGVFLEEASLTNGVYTGAYECTAADGKKLGSGRETNCHPESVDWASVRALLPQDRPIAAGDWVECVEGSDGRDGNGLTVGSLWQVASVGELRSGAAVSLYGHPLRGLWRASRFKRVDGPHPEKTSAPRITPADRGSVAPAVPDTGLLRERTCESCPQPPQSSNHRFCVYCGHRESDHATALLMRDRDDNSGATDRLAAGLASERPRPEGSGKALAELAKPHPWSCDE